MKNIIPEDTADEFAKAALKLVDIENYVDFQLQADSIYERWPLCRSWIDWWLQNSAAKTLFKSQRQMAKEAAAKIPDTTNAQEAMNNFFI